MCVCLLGGPITGQRERTITKAQKEERERERKMEREKITHVLAIKDGLGLEEEESHIVDCRCCDLFPSSLFLLSIDGSVYFTFVKNKENINMTRRRRRRRRSRKDRLPFCTRILYSGLRLLTERVMMIVVVSFFFFSSSSFFFVSREMNVPMQKIDFSSSSFSFLLSFVCSFVRSLVRSFV